MHKTSLITTILFLLSTTTVCFSQEIVRYIENGDNTVTDTATGLIWQQADDGNLYTWQEALDYCNYNTATLPGGSWRLPNIKELESIVDDANYSPASSHESGLVISQSLEEEGPGHNPENPGPQTISKYWSASSHTGWTSSAWNVDFIDGTVRPGNKTNSYFVRCVR